MYAFKIEFIECFCIYFVESVCGDNIEIFVCLFI